MSAMTGDPDDRLLRAYVLHHDREAMEQLVRRHIGFVYACALRQTSRDVHLAEDVTQAVFILLASKARSIGEGGMLRSWLFSTTRYAAANALKMQARRCYHERHAAAQRQDQASMMPSTPNPLLPLLDEAIAHLGGTDRAGVLLSFFDNKTFREVGAALGVSEEAARKRVTRAVGKLRSFFASRGVTVSADALAQQLGCIALMSSAAPAGLIESTVASAWSATTAFCGAGAGAGAGAGSSGALTIAKGAANMIALAKLKAVAAVLAIGLILCGGGVGLVALAHAGPGDAKPATEPAAAPGSAVAVQFPSGGAVELLGVTFCPASDKTWWNADGSPAPEPCDPAGGENNTAAVRQLCFRLRDIPDDATVAFKPSSNMWSHEQAKTKGQEIAGQQILLIAQPSGPTLDVSVRIASGQWETVGESGPQGYMSRMVDKGSVAIGPAYEQDAGTCVVASHDIPDCQSRLVAIGGGNEHLGQPRITLSPGRLCQMTVWFDLPMDQIERIELQVRNFDRIATFKNITLDPRQRTNVQATTSESK
jgi:RNA polymerase sigma factor (sigma-70 family)